MLYSVLALFAAYFLGAIPWAYIISKYICHINIMEHGSGNVGATNTFRVLGPKYGSVVFLLDLGKGFAAAMIGGLVGGETLSVFTGLIAIVAHTLSIFLHFKGGKGVATGAGVIFWWCPPAIICALIVWAVLALLTGYISVASIIACICCCIFIALFDGTFLQILFCSLAVAYIVFKHRGNIKRLYQGTENRVDWKELIKKRREKKEKNKS